MINLILAALLPGVQIDGAWLDAEAARGKGLLVSEAEGRVTLENRSDAIVRPEEIGWRKEGMDDFDVGGNSGDSPRRPPVGFMLSDGEMLDRLSHIFRNIRNS